MNDFEVSELLSEKLLLCIYPGVEPEATTAPEGGFYNSIIELVLSLRCKFPDVPILIKNIL